MKLFEIRKNGNTYYSVADDFFEACASFVENEGLPDNMRIISEHVCVVSEAKERKHAVKMLRGLALNIPQDAKARKVLNDTATRIEQGEHLE